MTRWDHFEKRRWKFFIHRIRTKRSPKESRPKKYQIQFYWISMYFLSLDSTKIKKTPSLFHQIYHQSLRETTFHTVHPTIFYSTFNFLGQNHLYNLHYVTLVMRDIKEWHKVWKNLFNRFFFLCDISGLGIRNSMKGKKFHLRL